MTTDAPTTTGLHLPCIHCGEAEAELSLQLWEVSFKCEQCDACFTAEEVRDAVARWQAALAWLDAMPRRSEP